MGHELRRSTLGEIPLRNKVAQEIVRMLSSDPFQTIPDGSCAKVWEANLGRADTILAIPEIATALAAARSVVAGPSGDVSRLQNALLSNAKLSLPLAVHECVEIVDSADDGSWSGAVIVHAEPEEWLCASVYRRPDRSYVAVLVKVMPFDRGKSLVECLRAAFVGCQFAPVYAQGPIDSFSATITFEAAIIDLADIIMRIDPALAFRPCGNPTSVADLRCLIAYEDHKIGR